MTLDEVLLVLHIAFVVAAFGTNFVQSILMRRVKAGSSEAAAISVDVTQRYTLPALVVAMLFGIALVVTSDGRFGFDAPWISASFAVVIVLGVLAWFVMLPAEKKLAVSGASEDERKKSFGMVSMATGMFHLGFLVLLVLMVWKPGS